MRIALLPLLLSLHLVAHTQQSERMLHIQQSTTAIKLDGNPDESAWQSATVLTDFQRQFPVDTGLATARTEIRLTFDAQNLYIAAVCYQQRSSYTVPSLKRDFPSGTSDVLNILLNPSKDGLNGFLFGISPLNVQREALIDNGTTLSYEWDNRWESAVQNFDDRWVAEIAIPFKTLRYTVSQGDNSWLVNFLRGRLNTWEVSTWRPVPQQFPANNLAFTGTLYWDTPPPKPGVNIALIPYSIGSYTQDYKRNPNSLELEEKTGKWSGDIGGDAKIGITPSLNLDLTFNPDFSQVEVDRQVANLSRFELFFPERRQFFLENRDLFAMFGFPGTRPFFSRRIGLARNPLTGFNESVPILAGGRLSGKINDDWRIGLLNMQTKRVEWDSMHALPGANFTVVTLQRKMFGRSALSGIFVDKENALGSLNETQRAGYNSWNRIAGLEYNLNSADNRWTGEWYYHRSFSPDPGQRGYTLAQYLGYSERHLNVFLAYMRVDSNYTAEAGFVPRNGIQNFYPGIGWTFYPKHRFINTWRIGVEGDLNYSFDWQETDRDLSFLLDINLKDQTSMVFRVFNNYTFLFEDFDPTNLNEPGTLPLPGNKGYAYSGARFDIVSSTTYNLQGEMSLTAGRYFNGRLLRMEGDISYRWQPLGTFAMSYSFNRIRLPAPYAAADFWLLGPRAEMSFTRKLFASAFFQYNTQANNFNINARLQWRFAPVSDVFLVYTDNSYAEPVSNAPVRFFSPKNKAIVLKVVYWLNV